MNPLILPLNIGKDDTFRVSWKGRLYKATAAMVLPRKLTTPTDVDEVIESTQLVLKLQEFAGALREKMFAALAPGKVTNSSASDVFGVVARVHLQTGTVTQIEDVRRTKVLTTSQTVNFLGDESELLNLDTVQRDELIKSLNQSFTASVLEALRQPFVSFAPQLTQTWKEQNLSTIQADKLVPFQMLFPNAQPIERFVDGERFVIDDLYCTNPTCACTDVTCVVLKFDPAAQQEVAWGGFKWAVDTEKFKVLPQFSSKFNAAEWFKQFDKSSGVDLKLLLASRQAFMRKEFISARKQARSTL